MNIIKIIKKILKIPLTEKIQPLTFFMNNSIIKVVIFVPTKNGGNMTQTTIKKLKFGDTFRFRNDDKAPLWKRYGYSRTNLEYECIRKDEENNRICCIYVKGETEVFI